MITFEKHKKKVEFKRRALKKYLPSKIKEMVCIQKFGYVPFLLYLYGKK